jgi:hypothetical protein
VKIAISFKELRDCSACGRAILLLDAPCNLARTINQGVSHVYGEKGRIGRSVWRVTNAVQHLRNHSQPRFGLDRDRPGSRAVDRRLNVSTARCKGSLATTRCPHPRRAHTGPVKESKAPSGSPLPRSHQAICPKTLSGVEDGFRCRPCCPTEHFSRFVG